MCVNSMEKQAVVIRLKFTKESEVKYISHLDLMRTFQRAIRRSELPISYSSGFNPHQEISFGAPLSLGVTSDAEYVDIKFDGLITVDEILTRLADKLPVGIKPVDGVVLKPKAKSAMGIVTHAKYTICMLIKNITPELVESKLGELADMDHILVMKEQPKKDFALKEIDIKPMIMNIKVVSNEADRYCIKCLLLSGSRANLKPELLVTALREHCKLDISSVRINREEVYAEANGQLLDLLQYASMEKE